MLLYIGGMIAFGFMGQRRVSGGDDYATARGGYGPFVLAIALASTTASGAIRAQRSRNVGMSPPIVRCPHRRAEPGCERRRLGSFGR